jgi:hypothetical protein
LLVAFWISDSFWGLYFIFLSNGFSIILIKDQGLSNRFRALSIILVRDQGLSNRFRALGIVLVGDQG